MKKEREGPLFQIYSVGAVVQAAPSGLASHFSPSAVHLPPSHLSPSAGVAGAVVQLDPSGLAVQADPCMSSVCMSSIRFYLVGLGRRSDKYTQSAYLG